MLKDEDRIFKNLYNDLGWEIDKALQRGDWSQTKYFISNPAIHITIIPLIAIKIAVPRSG